MENISDKVSCSFNVQNFTTINFYQKFNEKLVKDMNVGGGETLSEDKLLLYIVNFHSKMSKWGVGELKKVGMIKYGRIYFFPFV